MRRLCFTLLLCLFSGSHLHSLESYSLTDGKGIPLDHKLVELLKIKNGVFIEVGANDGLRQSNTALLEKYFNWRGILIEPSPNVYKKLCANRPKSQCFCCALGSFSQNNTYVWGDFDSSLMSSVDGVRLHRRPSTRVHMRSLQSILDEVGIDHINFFSLDTEGYEYNILQGIDFQKVKFDYLLIEIYNWDLEKIVSFLSDNGYEKLENFSLHHLKSTWDGTHDDYLFVRRNLSQDCVN